MKPCAFEYFAPGSVQEALALIQQHQGKILAGGQSLIPLMNFRLGRPEVLIDINRIPGLAYIRQQGAELQIGALTREREVELSPLVRQQCPLLSAAVSHVGHTTIRNRGTFCGSIAHADPSAEIPAAMCVLEGKIKAVSAAGETVYNAEDFFLTYLTTALEADQMVIEASVPVLPAGTGWSFVEMSRRSGDFAIVCVATLLFMDNGTCTEARIALSGVASTPVRARDAEAVLSGQKITPELIMQASALVPDATDPESDYHASAEYRRDMSRVLSQRSLTEALARAQGGN
jgi:CO/xanthine dehydrogenase FAD-binding subunit